MTCAPSEDSDQPGHPPSLIGVFAVRMKKHWILSCPLSAQRRLWSDWADTQADLSLRWALRSCFLVLSCCLYKYCMRILYIDINLTFRNIQLYKHSLRDSNCYSLIKLIEFSRYVCERTMLETMRNRLCLTEPCQFEPQHDKTSNMTRAPSEDSDQPGHPRSAQRRLIRLGGCPGWSEYSLDAQVSFVLCCGSSQFVMSNEKRHSWLHRQPLRSYKCFIPMLFFLSKRL